MGLALRDHPANSLDEVRDDLVILADGIHILILFELPGSLVRD